MSALLGEVPRPGPDKATNNSFRFARIGIDFWASPTHPETLVFVMDLDRTVLASGPGPQQESCKKKRVCVDLGKQLFFEALYSHFLLQIVTCRLAPVHWS